MRKSCFYARSALIQIYVWYFSSMGIQTLMFLCFFIIQVQSYNLNREHHRKKVALEIRNKKGMLSNLGFLKQERTRNILCFSKKSNNTIPQMLVELGTKEEDLD